MRLSYLFIGMCILLIIIISFNIEKFSQEIKDEGNANIDKTKKSLSDFDKVYAQINSMSSKSPLLQDVYIREKSVNDDIKPVVNDLVIEVSKFLSCDDGTYYNSLNKNCDDCKDGGTCVDGKFKECPGNAYNPVGSANKTQCTICPQGSSSYGYQGTMCAKCLPGTYIDVRLSSGIIKRCQPCPNGQINYNEGNSTCVLCPKNNYCNRKRYTKAQDINESVYSYQFQCPSGSSTILEGEPKISDRIIYENGIPYKIGNSLASECITCKDGTLKTGCVEKCPVGKYCKNIRISDEKVDEQILNCPEGTFNNKTGSSSITDCIPCPTGMFSIPGSSICKNLSECPDGYYIEGQKWVICPEGYYCTKGIKTACENGKWSSPGSSTCSDCPVDSMCRNGVKKPRPTPEKIADCLDGYYYDAATSKCVLCAFSFSCTKGLKTRCNNTDGFSEYYDTVSNTCKICPVGYSCNNGILTVCPDGKNTDDNNGKALIGKTFCSICPKGVVCKNGIKTLCPDGQTTTNPGFTECKSCDPGYYRDSKKFPTHDNNAGFCFNSDNAIESDQNKCPPGYICPVITNPDKTKATVKILCDKDKDDKALYADIKTNTCIICEENNYCVNGIRNKCPMGKDSLGNEFDLRSYAGASKCTRPNGYLCPTNSGDCLSGCCGKTGWYDVSNKCQNKSDVAYGCL